MPPRRPGGLGGAQPHLQCARYAGLFFLRAQEAQRERQGEGSEGQRAALWRCAPRSRSWRVRAAEAARTCERTCLFHWLTISTQHAICSTIKACTSPAPTEGRLGEADWPAARPANVAQRCQRELARRLRTGRRAARRGHGANRSRLASPAQRGWPTANRLPPWFG